MNAPEGRDIVLPARLARRRRIVGRLVVGVFCANVAFALLGAWALNGPAAGLTRFRLGYWGWAGTLFAASAVAAVPIVGPLAARLLRPPPEDEEPARPGGEGEPHG